MWKLAMAAAGFIIFAVLISLGNVTGVAGNLALLLFTAFGAIFLMVLAISIAPWLADRGY